MQTRSYSIAFFPRSLPSICEPSWKIQIQISPAIQFPPEDEHVNSFRVFHLDDHMVSIQMARICPCTRGGRRLHAGEDIGPMSPGYHRLCATKCVGLRNRDCPYTKHSISRL